MKRDFIYLLTVLGLVVLITNSSLVEAESNAIEMNLNITDSFYTNLEDKKSSLEDDIVTEFEINLVIAKFKDSDDFEWDDFEWDDFEWDDDEYEDISIYEARFRVYLRVSLVLPSGYTFRYFLVVYIGFEDSGFIIHFYNHATESGWYRVSIKAYVYYFELSAYDELIFDPPGGTGETDPPEIEIFAK